MDSTHMIMCGLKGLINDKLNKGEIREKMEEALRFQEWHLKRDFLGTLNEWYPFPEKRDVTILQCSGFDIKEPVRKFEDNRFVFSMDIYDKPQLPNIDRWCDGYLHIHQDPVEMKKKLMKPIHATGSHYVNDRHFYYWHHFIRTFSKQIDNLEWHQRGLTPLITLYSTYWPLRDWCSTYHTLDKSEEWCALSYLDHY